MESSAALLALPPITPAYTDSRPSAARAEAIATLRAAELLLEQSRYGDALRALGEIAVPAVSNPDLALRILFAESWARMSLGQVEAAVSLLERARALAEAELFTNVDRAEAMFRLGCCRLKLGKLSNAIALFSSALSLTEDDALASGLRAQVLDRRSRCYQLQREWEAAQVDAERSLELAEAIGDDRLAAAALMQCSLVAQRRGAPAVARCYAERARTLADAVGDRQTLARVLNNLGGLSFLLDEPETAVGYLTESFSLSLELGNDADAAQAVSSLAQIHLRCGAPQLAEEQARHALSILNDRVDYLDERGNARLVLGRALLELDRDAEAMTEFAEAEWLFERLGSTSHTAAAWAAQADVYRRRGDVDAAMTLYRRASLALQDFRF